MLTHLFIRNFAIVHQLELGLRSGLTVLTGETGAGKSILIDALSLALGERADSSAVREGVESAEIIAGFELPPGHDALLWLQAQQLDTDQECLVRRVVSREKSSRAYINGRPVPVQQLKELGNLLVDIHGQHEHQSLLKREVQRQILDDFAGLTEQVSGLGDTYEGLRGLQSRIQALRQQNTDRAGRIELLRYQVGELESLGLEPGEYALLEEEQQRLANGKELLEGARAACFTLFEDDEQSVDQVLGNVIRKLEALVGHDPKLNTTLDLLQDAGIQIREAASQLQHYSDQLELDPERLQWLDQRIGTCLDLGRKHQVKPDELPAVLAALQQELDDIEDADTSLSTLETKLAEARKAYNEQAREISAERVRGAARLSEKVTTYMQDLGMEGGQFEVSLIPVEENEMTAHGLERVEFLVSANPGQPNKPISRVASGGELSRISLALQVVIAGLGRVPTLIFDEVDVGVGGRVAEIVGKLLRQLSETRQVMCITHLAQVAAQGHQHFQVSKQTENGATLTQIRHLPEQDRIQEIARMIGGIEISQQTLAHAQDMLDRVSA